ncbi:MAG: trimeric intracellular cation channel family protein [Actinomycetes bacterium]
MNGSELAAGTVALLAALDLIGVFANAVLGGSVARQERFDPIGFGALAIVSGLGGGLVRDVLLQTGPPVALVNPAYLAIALAGAGLAFLLHFEHRAWRLVFPYVDALALGCWAAVGAQKALLSGLAWLPSLLLGVVTAVGGGVIRDLAVGRRPTVFGGNTLYATCALLASGVAVAGTLIGHSQEAALLATVLGAASCLLARRRGWMLPESVSWRSKEPT